MSNQYPDRITIEEYGETVVSPLYAVLTVGVEGEASVFGNEALKKSKEIVLFITDLESAGYSADNISLKNIFIKTETGRFFKSSQAKFTLTLGKLGLDIVPAILGIISSQKNIAIEYMNYEFGRLTKEKLQLYQEACAAAKKQAEVISMALGVPLLGVYTMMPRWSNLNNSAIWYRGSRQTRGGGPDDALSGLDFMSSQKSKLRLTLEAEFRVGGFT